MPAITANSTGTGGGAKAAARTANPPTPAIQPRCGPGADQHDKGHADGDGGEVFPEHIGESEGGVEYVHGDEMHVGLGGEDGITVTVSAGDVLVLPAGTGDKRLSAGRNLLVVGAYPPGKDWDLCRGDPGERSQVMANIQAVPLPETDPVFGHEGPLITAWLAKNDST